jgi:hypothetical protein
MMQNYGPICGPIMKSWIFLDQPIKHRAVRALASAEGKREHCYRFVISERDVATPLYYFDRRNRNIATDDEPEDARFDVSGVWLVGRA